MKSTLFYLLIFLSCSSYGQSFDNAIARFISDSDFTVRIDSAGHEYVNIEPYKINLKTTYTKLYFEKYSDFGNQPYQILPRRDTLIGPDTIVLSAVIGITQSANAHFKLVGTATGGDESIGFTNTNSNAYSGCHAFLSTKFLYWYFCDQNGITISD